ncbi:MAG: hypothetical protein OHK0029_03780 [Armatimonadaceae bacterium]
MSDFSEMSQTIHRISSVFLAACAIGACAAPVFAQKDFASAKTLANQHITAAQLRDYLTFIASNELQGRDTPSPGLDIAAKFIATHMSRWGLKPAGDKETYFQTMMLGRTQVDVDKSTATLAGTALKPRTDFIPFALGGNGSAEGSVVYASHGYYAKNLGIDAYNGVDVRGKIVVVSGRAPKGINFRQLTQSGKQGEDWMDPAAYAKKSGAVGIIFLGAATNRNNWEAFANSATRGGGRFRPQQESSEKLLPAVYLAPEQVEKLFAGEKATAEAIYTDRESNQAITAFPLSDSKKLAFNSVVVSETVPTQNVVAVLEGSDPTLKNEYVALGAHYDHVGVNPRLEGDQIFNGADDDGSGTVALMGIAEALSKSPVKPKRSILFVWHCGEEKGLWGSEYFVENPTVPLDKITAQINIDMIGRSKQPGDTKNANRDLSGPNEIYLIGATMMSTELEQLAKTVNTGFLNLGYDLRYDAPDDPNRFFFRSDHYNYAKKGIPILFYFDGVHEDYHKVGDEVEKIDFDKMTKVTRTVLVTVTEIANRPKRLVVDKKLDR